MATVLADIANNAGGKIGGFGDQLTGEALITTAQLLANADKISQWVNIKYPIVRQKIITDFAAMETPFNETVKFADLGDDLKQDDIAISTIVSVGGVVTVTTAKVHGRSTGDTVFLADIKGTLVNSLNGTTKTITVTTTTAFTLDGVTGTDDWDHTESTGIVSKVPEIGYWNYAFTLPSDYFVMVRHTDEYSVSRRSGIVNGTSYYNVPRDGVKAKYQFDKILNRDGDGFLLLTNNLTNKGGDSAYIEYAIDQQTFSLFSTEFEECIATLLAAELCPIIGRDLDTRQQILAEYKAITVPEAKRNIQAKFNNHTKRVNDFSGGRSTGGLGVGAHSGLGTYVDSQGNRRSI